MHFNLLTKPFIPATRTNGKPAFLSLMSTLELAGELREIRAASPLDTFALYRFLLAVLQWCNSRPTAAVLAEIPEERRLPGSFLKKIHDNSDRFEMLGCGSRFYQAASASTMKPNRPAADLFLDLPADTEINHFCHTSDQTVGLCLACSALGLIRLPAFATQGGSGKPPSINQAPPVYYLPLGLTLLDTLWLNWPMRAVRGDRPAWSSACVSIPSGHAADVGPMEGLTWQPRMVWLGPPVEASGRRCSRCGASGQLISSLVFAGGRSAKSDPRKWADPHVAYVSSRARQKRPSAAATQEETTAHRAADPLKYAETACTHWRRGMRAVLESIGSSGDAVAIRAIASAGDRLPAGCDLRVLCVKPFTKQAKPLDTNSSTWLIPSRVRDSQALQVLASTELCRLDNTHLFSVLVKALRRKSGDRPEIRAALASLAQEREGRLRHQFHQFMARLGKSDSTSVEKHIADWRHHRNAILEACVRSAHALVAKRPPLRRGVDSAVLGRRMRRAVDFADMTEDQDTSTPEAPNRSPSSKRAKTRRGK